MFVASSPWSRSRRDRPRAFHPRSSPRRLGRRPDEHRAALLQVHQRKRCRRAATVGDELPVGRSAARRATVAVEDVVEMPVPRVSVRNSVRKISAARVLPHPAGAGLTICRAGPSTRASSCEDADVLSARRSRAARPARAPCRDDLRHDGLPTVSSNLRHISSTSTASWSSPRPCTPRVRPLGRRTRSETFPTSS